MEIFKSPLLQKKHQAFVAENIEMSEKEIMLTQIYYSRLLLEKNERIRYNTAVLVNINIFYLIAGVIFSLILGGAGLLMS